MSKECFHISLKNLTISIYYLIFKQYNMHAMVSVFPPPIFPALSIPHMKCFVREKWALLKVKGVKFLGQ